MQFRILLICSVIGLSVAQRGHYAGSLKEISGSRYSNQNSDAPAQSNFAAPSQGSSNVRLDETQNFNPEPTFQQQQPGFGAGLYNPGFQQQGFPFAPFGFNSGFNGR